jgi:hypothetical protein
VKTARAPFHATAKSHLVEAVLALNSAWNHKEPHEAIAGRLDLCRRLALQATPVGSSCARCNGRGCTDEGDPEIGSALFTCDRCNGSGETTVMTHGHGPDDYDVSANCPKCAGSGVAPSMVGEPMAKLRIYMDTHDMGQSLAPNPPFKVARAGALKRADDLPIGEYSLYLAPVPAGVQGDAARPLKAVDSAELRLELHLRSGPQYQCQSPACRSYEDGPGKWDTCPSCGLKGFLCGSFVLDKDSPQYRKWEERAFAKHRTAAQSTKGA